jgi:hypothetical protein
LGTLNLVFPFTDFADTVSPSGSAELAFDGNNGNDAAVNKDGGSYRTTYLGFPFEAIGNQSDRASVMGAFACWCGLDVIDPPDDSFEMYIPVMAGDGGGNKTAGLPQAGFAGILSLIGLVAFSRINGTKQ